MACGFRRVGHVRAAFLGERPAGEGVARGLQAALLAARGYTSSARGLEAPRGFLHVLAADGADAGAVTRELGTQWEINALAYKPYPCGVVIHPVIDGCLDLRAAHATDATAVASIEIDVNPLAIKLCGNPAPRDGLEAKLSIAHSVAAALLDGAAGVAQYADARVRDRGSRGRPLSEVELDTKFRGLAGGVLAPAQIETTLGVCAALESCADMGELARAAAG